ncbi:MAG: hypothetical protein WCK70_18955 [Chloroflexales bacterium]|jgi:LAS superfamily LD-carboxypeptidase LdcB
MTTRLDPTKIAADRNALKAIGELVDYQPVNTAYSTSALQQIEATLTQAEAAEERARRVYEQARIVRDETAQAFHENMRAAKNHVLAQYGDDSYAVQAIGWTRRSARRRPMRRVSAQG